MGLRKLEAKQVLYPHKYGSGSMILVIIAGRKKHDLKKSLNSKHNGHLASLLSSVPQLNGKRSTSTDKSITEIAEKCLWDDWCFFDICFPSGKNFNNEAARSPFLPSFSLSVQTENLKAITEFTRSKSLFGVTIIPSSCSYSQVILGFMHNDTDRKIQTLTPMFSQLRIRSTDSTSPSTQKQKSHDVKDKVPRDQDKKFVQTPTSLMFAVLGWSGSSPTVTIEAFDPTAQKWFYISQNTFVRRAYHGVVMLGILIYVIGGFDGRCCHSTTFCFHVEKRLWYKRPHMLMPRCYVTALGCRGMVYALGGFDGDERFRCCERFDPFTRRWRYLASMNERRSDASGAVHQGKIYVCGGFNGAQVLPSSEMYDPESDQWTLIPNMLGPRSGHSLISHKGVLLVIGGFDGHTRLRTVELYDGKRNTWTQCAPMLNVRSNFATAVLQDQLYVIGGYNGETTCAEVERFDDVQKTWNHAQGLNKHRSALGACVFSDSMIVSMCSIPGHIVIQAVNVEQSSP